jgi:hypothetical protein
MVDKPIEQTAPPRLLTRADCAWRGAGIFAGTAAVLGVVGCAFWDLRLAENPQMIHPGLLWDHLRFAATFCPPLAVLGALLAWYHYESVQPVEENTGCLRAFCILALCLPRAVCHGLFYTYVAILCAVLIAPLAAISPLVKASLRKEASSAWEASRLIAHYWTFVAFLGWPQAGALYEDDQRTSLAEMQRSLALLCPLPLLFALFLMALGTWNAEKDVPAWLWPFLTFWLGDYLVLWHVLRLHAAGRVAVAEWSPRFSLRALVLAVLAWGAWLTLLTWVWRE